jgi:hypothetical protein
MQVVLAISPLTPSSTPKHAMPRHHRLASKGTLRIHLPTFTAFLSTDRITVYKLPWSIATIMILPKPTKRDAVNPCAPNICRTIVCTRNTSERETSQSFQISAVSYTRTLTIREAVRSLTQPIHSITPQTRLDSPISKSHTRPPSPLPPSLPSLPLPPIPANGTLADLSTRLRGGVS